MNSTQRQQARDEAIERIEAGEDPAGLVHVLYYPQGCGYEDEEIMGLSGALPAGSAIDGYISRYFTLAELAE